MSNKLLGTSLLNEDERDSTDTPAKDKLEVDLNTGDSFNDMFLKSELLTLQKRLNICCILSILMGIILFIYIGPFNVSQLKLETEDMTVAFYAWDNLLVVLTFMVQGFAFSRRTFENRPELMSFKRRLSLMTAL